MAPVTRIRRALKSAARLPIRITRGNHKDSQSNEEPIVVLRVQVVGCVDLASKDKGGKAVDPFVVLSLLDQRRTTSSQKKNNNPTWPAAEATYDFPLYLSQAADMGGLELIVWDKDLLKKDYLGEAALTMEKWFKDDEALAFNHERNFPFDVPLISSRSNTSASGAVKIKLGFAPQSELHQFPDYSGIYKQLLQQFRGATPSLASAPPTEGIGTIRSHLSGPAFEDDGLSSEDEDDEEEEEVVADHLTASPAPTPHAELPQVSLSPPQQPAAVVTPVAPVPVPAGGKFAPFKALKRPSFASRSSSKDVTTDTSSTAPVSRTPTPTPEKDKKKAPRFKRGRKGKGSEYNLDTSHDMLGIVMIEINGAENLPKLRNLTRTGWDMDPFVVVSFGKKVFRTRVIRHSLNPKWDEKLLFHVRRYEAGFNVQFSILDWDKITSNDHIGDVVFPLGELMKNAPKPDENGLYPITADGTHDMQEFRLPMTPGQPGIFETGPTIVFKAKYQPYAALRQHFWRQYLKQYDSDETATLSTLEITSMLDSLGSTLSHETIKSFFSRNGKDFEKDELTIDEVVLQLEHEISLPRSEKKTINPDEPGMISGTISGTATPSLMGDSPSLKLEKLDFSGPPRPEKTEEIATDVATGRKATLPTSIVTEPSQQPLGHAIAIALSEPTPVDSRSESRARAGRNESSSSSSDADDSSGKSSEDSVERVINVKTCPLCHRPRLSAKGEMDIVTHLALCASQDWNRVDRIVVGNFVTPSQAQRKWFARIVTQISTGAYQLGANSANIIVQNRITGQLEEEKMQVYVRLGIRLLYKGAKGRMEGARARRLLKSLSIKQGKKYDSPESALEIPAFIEFHNLKVAEIRDPLDSFKTFNEFFYRKLKEDARPVANPDDPATLVSGADCRMMVFPTVTDATKLWIKGRDFTVSKLLGNAYKDQHHKYIGGALAIFRLAPQDYHRFHTPVDGVIGPVSSISGEYYTVNPQAIRTSLDVYGENVRKIVPIDSPTFGRVMAVCVGAMMVGSIVLTAKEGERVARGQEFGYFAFGGSTIVLLFEQGAVEWDEDLLINSRACLETLVQVGMGVGKSKRPAQAFPPA